ncbi:MAG: hypothetical protein AB7O04_11435 [Hyphomonadaceae bacterium]
MRIVVRSPDPRGARRAQELLAAAGIEAAALTGEADAEMIGQGEDIVIVDACGAAAAHAAQIAARAAAARVRPLAIVAGGSWESPPAAGLAAAAPFDAWLALDAPPTLLARQVQAAERMGIAEIERAQRRATAAAVGVAAPSASGTRRLKSLYIGAPSPFFLALERMFAAHGGLVTAAFSSFSGFDHLHDEHFDAVVLNGAADPATAISLCAALRRNAGLHHLPTMVVTQPNDRATTAAAIERGAAAVVPEDAPSEHGLAWVFDSIRRERRRKDAEHELRALRDRMGDPRTGLFTEPNFEAHLIRLAEHHHAAGRPLSLVALRVHCAPGARTPADAVWRKGFNEVATLASRLVRDTDCAAALGRDLIVAALPATRRKGAQRTAERIAAVGECTAFAAGEGEAGPLVFEQSAVELKPGESGRAMLARALEVFVRESATA